MTFNPYESPQAASATRADTALRPALPPTRWKAAIAAMRRGANFGFRVFIVIEMLFLGASALVAAIAMFVLRAARDEILGEIQQLNLMQIGKGIGGLVVVSVLFAVLYGAIPGALMVGLAAAIRWRRPSNATDSNNVRR
jgi:hypothetical protein